ncbi:MAG: Asp-tRNA(Asn)/Glu-tRNA(Gln) amidotransferase subunit GatC [Bacteroidetes bacterium]|nr:Asp-tRNA(Asn)/Glu-tRNA(Gln) amidotransferase subunit GatC [Bacteroidota bacterium]
MSISNDQVRAVARLARLHFSDAEVEELAVELSRVLDYVDKLGEVDTSGVEPMSHAMGGVNVFRDDDPTTRATRQQLLTNAPDADAEYFRVPKVIRQS